LQLEGISIPIIGIGGITLADIPALRQTGLYGVAVSSAISNAADPVAQARLFCCHFSND
jgi:thiamine-phosphate pyrophosphorylase